MEECDKAILPETIFELNNFIQQAKPKIIICHSLGCRLLLFYLETNSLPKSVNQIILLQADIDDDFKIPNHQLANKLKSGQIRITNCYYPLDYSLLISSLINRKIRAGLVGWKSPLIYNKFMAAEMFKNPHTSCLSSKSLRNLLSQYLS